VRISAREKRLLALLGLVAGVALLRALWLLAAPPPPPPLVAGLSEARPAPRGRGSRAPAAPPTSVVLLRTDRLEAEPEEFAVGRDLFRFGPPPAPPAPPPPTADELARMRELEAERRRQAEERARLAAIPRPPEVTLRFLGSFGPPRSKIAVLTDATGARVWNARVGDVLDGKFIVDKIGFESVDLRFVGFEDAPPRRLEVGG
jgi:hypothetical protein